MSDPTKDSCLANLLGKYLICPFSKSPLQIYENMFLPQTFEMQGLVEERKQLTIISQNAFEAPRLISSELANNFLDEFEDISFKTVKLKDHLEESKPSEIIQGNSVDAKLMSNDFSILISNVPKPIAPFFPIKIKHAEKHISSLISHWSDWKKVLNEWLEPSSFETILINDEKPLGEIQPMKFKDKDGNIGEEATTKYSEKNNYFASWCKYYVKTYFITNNLQFVNSDWFLRDLNIDPFHKFQDYKFKIKEARMDSLKAVSEGCDALCKGYMDRAIVCFENVLLQEDYTPTSWYYLGLAQAAVGNDSQAICAFKRCMNLDFAQPDIYIELASSFINEGLYSSACHMLCFWLCMQETHYEAVYENIAKQKFGFFSLNQMPKSFVDESDLMNLLDLFRNVSKYKILKEKETKDQVIKSSYAKTLSENREIYQEAGFDPANSALNGAHLNTCLAFLFIMSNKLKEAHHYLLAAIQMNDKAPKLWNMLGAVLVEQKCYGEAIEAFKHALDIWPGYTMVRINIASLCQRLGLFREAADHLFQVFLQEEENSIRSSLWQQLNEIIIEINDPKLLTAWQERDLACLQEYLLM